MTFHVDAKVKVEATLDTIEAMRHQETTGYETRDWLALENSAIHNPAKGPLHAEAVDVDCRDKMTVWCIQVVDFCKFNRETVEITMSLLDRFLCTPLGVCAQQDRSIYQMASMAALYTAVKVHEPEAIDPKLVSSLSRGAYSAADIEAMEVKILRALDWRVNPPTSMAFVRELMELIPEDILNEETQKALLELTQFQTELAVCNYQLITVPSSTIAYAALMNSLESIAIGSTVVGYVGAILASALKIDCNSLSVVKAQNALYKSVVQHPVDGPLARKPRTTLVASTKASSRESPHGSPRSISAAQ